LGTVTTGRPHRGNSMQWAWKSRAARVSDGGFGRQRIERSVEGGFQPVSHAGTPGPVAHAGHATRGPPSSSESRAGTARRTDGRGRGRRPSGRPSSTKEIASSSSSRLDDPGPAIDAGPILLERGGRDGGDSPCDGDVSVLSPGPWPPTGRRASRTPTRMVRISHRVENHFSKSQVRNCRRARWRAQRPFGDDQSPDRITTRSGVVGRVTYGEENRRNAQCLGGVSRLFAHETRGRGLPSAFRHGLPLSRPADTASTGGCLKGLVCRLFLPRGRASDCAVTGAGCCMQ